MKAVRLVITGRVQAVGYRDWTMRTARTLGVSGWVRNRTDRAVEAMIAGEEGAVDAMVEACRRGPSQARVDEVDVQPAESTSVPAGFTQLPTV